MNDEPDKITCAACGYVWRIASALKEVTPSNPFYPVHGNVMVYREWEWVSYTLHVCPKCGTVRAEMSD